MSSFSIRLSLFLGAVLFARVALAQTTAKAPAAKKPSHLHSSVTLAEAQAFMKKVEDQLTDLGVRSQRAGWVQENFITDDTEAMSAQAQEESTAAVTKLALEARKFDQLHLPVELARKFELLRLALVAPAPNNDKERKELTEIGSWMDS